MTISNEIIRCKLEIEEKIVKLVMNLNYLGTELFTNKILELEVKVKKLESGTNFWMSERCKMAK